MPRNGSGTYSRSQSDYVFDTVIDETKVNDELDDVATALTGSIAKDGQTTTTALIPFASGIKTDTVSENTSGVGVTADSVLLKDGSITLGTAGTLTFEGATADAFETTLTVTDPTADRTITLPDGTGTVAFNDAASASAAGLVELATTAETETGTDATRAVTPDGLHDMTTISGAAWVLDEDNMVSDSATKLPTQQSVKAYTDTVDARVDTLVPVEEDVKATTSGDVEWTGLPADVYEIIIHFNNVSTSSTGNILVQLGDATTGGYVTTNYITGTTGGNSSTSGFVLQAGDAGAGLHGQMRITAMDRSAFRYTGSHGAWRTSSNSAVSGGGYSILAGVVDRVKITTTSGSLDAGAAALSYTRRP